MDLYIGVIFGVIITRVYMYARMHMYRYRCKEHFFRTSAPNKKTVEMIRDSHLKQFHKEA